MKHARAPSHFVWTYFRVLVWVFCGSIITVRDHDIYGERKINSDSFRSIVNNDPPLSDLRIATLALCHPLCYVISNMSSFRQRNYAVVSREIATKEYNQSVGYFEWVHWLEIF